MHLKPNGRLESKQNREIFIKVMAHNKIIIIICQRKRRLPGLWWREGRIEEDAIPWRAGWAFEQMGGTGQGNSLGAELKHLQRFYANPRQEHISLMPSESILYRRFSVKCIHRDVSNTNNIYISNLMETAPACMHAAC